MILLYTKFKLSDKIDILTLLERAFKWVSGMKNIPEPFKGLSWDGTNSQEWINGKNLVAVEMNNEMNIVAFRVTVVDEADELWTTDIVFNEKIHEIQIRLAREREIVSVDYDENFRLPYFLKQLLRDNLGGLDVDLPVCDKPLYLDDSNISIIEELISGKKIYSLPVIYVSHPFYEDEYYINVEELARDMAGCAHVLVEKTSETTAYLKSATKEKNAYNGAIDIFYEDDSFRYLKRSDLTANQYRYRISHAVYVRLAMRNIDGESSLSSIRLNNKIKTIKDNKIETEKLSLKIEELEEKRKYDNEVIESASMEMKQLQKSVNELELKVDSLTNALNRKNAGTSKNITLDYTENEFYDDEIKRIVIECIKRTLNNYDTDTKKSREYHLLNDIAVNNTVSEFGNSIKAEMISIFKKDRLSNSDIKALKGIGFVMQTGNHNKFVFHGDDRYIVTVPKTPSDYRSGENLAHDAVYLIFGRS